MSNCKYHPTSIFPPVRVRRPPCLRVPSLRQQRQRWTSGIAPTVRNLPKRRHEASVPESTTVTVTQRTECHELQKPTSSLKVKGRRHAPSPSACNRNGQQPSVSLATDAGLVRNNRRSRSQQPPTFLCRRRSVTPEFGEDESGSGRAGGWRTQAQADPRSGRRVTGDGADRGDGGGGAADGGRRGRRRLRWESRQQTRVRSLCRSLSLGCRLLRYHPNCVKAIVK